MVAVSGGKVVRAAGLDLSLTGAAACVLPSDWNCDWRAVKTMRVGRSLPKDAPQSEALSRLKLIRSEVLDFLTANCVDYVFVEEYAFSRANCAHSLGEVGGVVKLACAERGWPVQSVTASQARKFLLGSLPKADQKVKTHLALYRAGAPKTLSGDELDALVVASWGLAELGARSAMVLR